MGHLQYFAQKTGHEIDFILDASLAIEAKETPLHSDLKQLSQLAEKVGIHKSKLIGRHQSPRFIDYVWAGSLV
ncbi:hypothetical protein HY086_03105 [Candidatus Gottesmanbacteria bacterium]|nr:hypothetical protein [Candidatus Gottesmanbacteria bacterium]